MTQSAAIVTGRADAFVVAGVRATATRRHLVTAVTAFSAQIIALARVLLNVVANV